MVCFLESDSDIKQPFVCRNRLLGLESTSNTFIVSPKPFDDSAALPSSPINYCHTGRRVDRQFLFGDPQTDRFTDRL